MKKEYIKSVRQFLAVASEARKTGMADNPDAKKELKDIETIILARNYDKEKHKDKGQNMPPFSMIKKEDVDAYYAVPENDAAFQAYVKERIEAAKKSGRMTEDPTEEQLAMVKESYGKIQIAAKEAKEQWPSLGEDFKRKVELQTKLQQSQFLTQKYVQEVLSKKVKATDEEVSKYIAEHPELSPDEKKKKAEEVLQRVKNGEDFAKLAKELSEDPGSKENGGLYKGVTKGAMLPEFEQAALALEAGKVADAPVETKYGFHIIKLEGKGKSKGPDGKEEDTYDARHILIGTTYKDPENPMAQGVPVKDYVSQKLEEEKEKKILEEIEKNNPIEVAEDFEIKVPEMPKGMPGMPGMAPDGDDHSAPPPPAKEEKKPAAAPASNSAANAANTAANTR
jgi:parvulin-like peptidyl-prolyl isomerase